MKCKKQSIQFCYELYINTVWRLGCKYDGGSIDKHCVSLGLFLTIRSIYNIYIYLYFLWVVIGDGVCLSLSGGLHPVGI